VSAPPPHLPTTYVDSYERKRTDDPWFV